MAGSRICPELNRILEHNKNTDYGKKWGFANIKTVEAYQNAVPLTGYDDYAPLIELTTRLGEKDIFTALPLAGYSLTSGTTGVPRLIPCTQAHLDGYIAQLRALTAGVKGSTVPLLESMPKKRPYMDGVYLDSVSGMALTGMRKKLKDNAHARTFAAGAWTSPEAVLFPEEMTDTLHLRVLFALLDRNVEQIIAPFTWGVLEAFQYLEKNWELLLEDMERGSISHAAAMPESLRKRLEGSIKKNPKRAKELRSIFLQGFDEPVIPRIWPGCRRIVAAGTGSFRIYTEKLRRYFGNIPFNNGLYASSEALIGRALKDECEEYRLLPEYGFYEFLPEGETDEPKALVMEELTEGSSYSVVVTNNSGFYRYRLGDVVRVSRMENGVPIVTFSFRSSQTCSVAGTRITEADACQAVCRLQERSGIEFGDFCIWPDEEKGRYTFLLEPLELSGNVEKMYRTGRKELERLLEEGLREGCESYRIAVQKGKLLPAGILCLQPQTHLLYRDVERYRRKTAPDQIKPVRVLDNPVKEKFFFSMADRRMHGGEELDYYLEKNRRGIGRTKQALHEQ